MKIIIRTILSVSAAALLASCANNMCKIDPPPSVVGTDKEIAANAAASALGTAVSNVAVGGSYKNIVNKTYVNVGQDDVAFYLLLQAYNCESSRGHLAQADALLKTARQELARRHDAAPAVVASHPNSLTPTEKKVLKRSKLKANIAKTIEAPKPTPAPKPEASPKKP